MTTLILNKHQKSITVQQYDKLLFQSNIITMQNEKLLNQNNHIISQNEKIIKLLESNKQEIIDEKEEPPKSNLNAYQYTLDVINNEMYKGNNYNATQKIIKVINELTLYQKILLREKMIEKGLSKNHLNHFTKCAKIQTPDKIYDETIGS